MIVYFVKALETNLVKIGRTENLDKRLKALRTASPYRLEVMVQIPCKSLEHSRFVEAKAHELFKKTRRQGEWFKMGKEEKNVIKRLCDYVESKA